jgi:hypothetical protein
MDVLSAPPVREYFPGVPEVSPLATLDARLQRAWFAGFDYTLFNQVLKRQDYSPMRGETSQGAEL